MAISLGGLASGIDTASLVESLKSVAQQPINQLDERKAKLDAASTTISQISTKLGALKTAALALSTSVGYASFGVTSSDTGITVATTGSANVGSYDVEVSRLAKAQKTRGTTFGTSNTALGIGGTLNITLGSGTPKPVDILGSDTLADIAGKINNAGAGVTASVINDSGQFRILVQSTDTGFANAFTLDESGLGGGSLGFGDVGATYVDAKDAEYKVDNQSYSSASNQITGVIPGVKMTLTKETTSAATIQVSSDQAALTKKINTFISAYNDFVNAGHTAAGFGGTKAANSALSADSSIRKALHTIGATFSNEVPNTSGKYTTMGSIGLTVGRDGLLTLNSTKFDAAMSASPDAVRRLFVTDTTTGATGLMSTLMTSIDGLVSGTKAPLQARINSFSAQSKRLADSRIKMQSRLVDYEAALKKQFTAMDQLISKYKTQGAALDAYTSSVSSSNSGGSSS